VSSYIQRTLTAYNGNFQFRVWIRMTSEGTATSNDFNLVSYYTGSTLNKTISLVLNANGLSLNVTGSTLTQFTMSLGDLGLQWISVTMNVTTAGNGVTGSVACWVGSVYAGTVQLASISQATQTPNGLVRIGQAETGTGTNPAWQIAFFGFRSGFNAAPPDYTYRGKGYGSYGPA
jgi:hypothetical protein